MRYFCWLGEDLHIHHNPVVDDDDIFGRSCVQAYVMKEVLHGMVCINTLLQITKKLLLKGKKTKISSRNLIVRSLV